MEDLDPENVLTTFTYNSLEEVDAALFTGDEFSRPEARAVLRQYMARWERGLVEFDKMDAEG